MLSLNSIFCFSFMNWVSFVRFGPQLNRVLVFVCLFLKLSQGLRPWDTHTYPKFMGALPPPPPEESNQHTNFQAEGETKLHKPFRF